MLHIADTDLQKVKEESGFQNVKTESGQTRSRTRAERIPIYERIVVIM